MAVDRRLAAIDLHDKLELENAFARRLVSLNGQIVTRYGRALGTTGEVIDMVNQFGDQLATLLLTHYGRVAGAFSRRCTRLLPGEIQLTQDEEAKLDAAVDSVALARARPTAELILSTTQQHANQALLMAQQDAVERAGEGQPMSSREIALVAAAILRRKLAGRVSGIAITETQAIAEMAKLVELQVLLGQELFIELETRAHQSTAVKEWVSQGDSVVRPTHINADSVQVPVESPFVIGGQLLMHPGDRSLGAGPEETANCRCSSVPDLASVASARQDIVGTDNTRFPLISLVDDAISALLQ